MFIFFPESKKVTLFYPIKAWEGDLGVHGVAQELNTLEKYGHL